MCRHITDWDNPLTDELCTLYPEREQWRVHLAYLDNVTIFCNYSPASEDSVRLSPSMIETLQNKVLYVHNFLCNKEMKLPGDEITNF